MRSADGRLARSRGVAFSKGNASPCCFAIFSRARMASRTVGAEGFGVGDGFGASAGFVGATPSGWRSFQA